jgi:glutathione S-transferase
MPAALPALTTLIALLLYVMTALNVARARAKYKISAPAISGNPDFERIFRVQMNMLEQMVAFVPALWLFALFVNAAWASALGAVWIVARAAYATSYYRAAESRGPGFVIAFTAMALLWLGALWGVVAVLLRG